MKKILIVFVALLSSYTFSKNWDDYKNSCMTKRTAEDPRGKNSFTESLNYCTNHPEIIKRTDTLSQNCIEYACKEYATYLSRIDQDSPE
jgi:hypothetical protein